MREPLSHGTIVGRYRVDALVRERPRARLYAAQGLETSRAVTLAVIDPRGHDELEQLAHRAELLKQVDHRGVASVFDVGRHGSELFVARERVGGLRLDELLAQRGHIDATASVEIVGQVADALDALRREGVGYVDVGMHDVVVDADLSAPRAWVADLGLMREESEPALVAPEVRTGGARDERSDVYALGALLLTELTGDESDVGAVRRGTAALPGALDRVIASAVAEDPAARYATSEAFVRAARNAIDPRRAQPIRRRFRHAAGSSGGSPPDAGGGHADTRTPHHAYALLETPESVVAGTAFEIEVGLAEDPQVADDGPFELPPLGAEPYPLVIHVVLDGFALAAGTSPRVVLPVGAASPFPHKPLWLVTEQAPDPPAVGHVWATYSVWGKVVGTATRRVGIARTEELLEAARPDDPGSTTTVAFDSPWEAPDLTASIVTSDHRTLKWTFASKHEQLVTDATYETSLGDVPDRLARELIVNVPEVTGIAAFRTVDGAANLIADAMPPAFWPLLKAAAAHARTAVPTVLFNSRETYVPWELAALPEPLDPDLPPYLGVQAAVGRWVRDMPRAPEPPPSSDPAERLAVVIGRYGGTEIEVLRAAEEEAAALERNYGARRFEARRADIEQVLSDPLGRGILHFAMHARGLPGSLANGLVVVDDDPVGSMQIRSYRLAGRPLVFLNACEAAGVGEMTLGRAAGLAEAFLAAGACGVIAPMWEVDDVDAKELVRRFYAEAFGDGVAIADHLRHERAGFSITTPATTSLAYLFYGHPTARLRAVRSPAPDG